MTPITLVAAIILSLYLCVVIAAMLIPPKQHDPQRGVAIGCLVLVAAALAGVLAVLIVGEIYHFRWMVYTAFAIAVFPLVPMTGMAVMWVRKRINGD